MQKTFFFLLLFLSCLRTGPSFLIAGNAPRRVVKILKVTNGAPWGHWGPPQYCAEGTYAIGYSLKVEGVQGNGDDTALNAIALHCKGLDDVRSGGAITSTQGNWGNWLRSVSCHDINGRTPSFLTAYALQVEQSIGKGDDTAANYVKFACRDFAATIRPYELTAPPGQGSFGNMGSWSENCPANSAICGLQTKVEEVQNGGDDTALNNVEFHCCEENLEAGK
ncbi:vitelline membrane outer layer protein 1-like [Mercenaria mercenaria]|uniref:vitelline membrane outer layer protein 1-like n=1 Tax=Mercenaria mercenaria TaxID=6596 RepID=UPI00234EEA83|nr:vitelline membrane outer layer protein 1-like [Mercenaria mercenaria]